MMTIPPKPPVPPQIFPRVCDHHPDGVQTALAWCCFKAEALNPAPREGNSVDKQLKMQTKDNFNSKWEFLIDVLNTYF